MPDMADVRVERCVDPAAGCWEPADAEPLLAGTDRPLLVFIHGNRYSAAAAKAQGLQLARLCAGVCPRPPRSVIYSWPSDQQGLALKDGRLKYGRAHADGHYLAWLLGRVDPDRPVAIVAYSFGAIITLEAFEDLVVAERTGRTDVQPWTGRPGRTHVVFVAPAVRCDALAPRGPYREAVECIDRFTLVINSRDDALRFFPWLDRSLRAQALGYVGMPRAWLPAEMENRAIDAAGIVGKHHGLPLYLASPTLTRRITSDALDGIAP